MKRIMARTQAVSIKELTAQDTKHVAGGCWQPSSAGIDTEIVPGIWASPCEFPDGDSGTIPTLGINEGP